MHAALVMTGSGGNRLPSFKLNLIISLSHSLHDLINQGYFQQLCNKVFQECLAVCSVDDEVTL